MPDATAAGVEEKEVAPVITLIALGIGFILIVAIVVGVVDAALAPAWRRVAAERRDNWEARRLDFHGIDPDLAADDD